MSVIARQSLKYSIIGYIGFFLGTFSAIFIFPYNLVFYGKLRYILPAAEMIVPLVVFGVSHATVKFFHKTEKDNKHLNMLSLCLAFVSINFIVIYGIFKAIGYLFPRYQSTEFWKMSYIIMPLILVMSLSSVFNKYITNYKRIVVSNIFENLFPKIANLGAFILCVFLFFTENDAFLFFFAIFFFALIGYYIYLNKLEKLVFNLDINYFKKNNLWKNFITYSAFGFLGNVGSYIALKIDNVMIGEFLNFEENGVYSNILSIIAFISIPEMGLYNISAPIINKHLEENKYEELNIFYKKTSLSMFFQGLILFSCIVIGFPFLTEFMPKNGYLLKQAQPIVWILGMAYLFNLATGFNGHIISLSKYYRFNVVVMSFLAIVTIVINLYFIKYTHLRLLGIAIATFISLTLFNLSKIIFNYYKFKVSPFSIKMLYALLLCSISVLAVYILPNAPYSMINLIYKPLTLLLIIFIGNYFLRIFDLSKYINQKFLKTLIK